MVQGTGSPENPEPSEPSLAGPTDFHAERLLSVGRTGLPMISGFGFYSTQL